MFGSSVTAKFRLPAVIATAVVMALAAPSASARTGPDCVNGAAGIGDSYFPGDGNGGYDVQRYDLDITYDPATDRLDGEALIRARTTQALCRFNLDLVGLEVEAVEVNGRAATWTRAGQELTITPDRPLRANRRFTVEVTYGGVPIEFVLPGVGIRTGFMKTDDGANVLGQPEAASAWYRRAAALGEGAARKWLAQHGLQGAE